MNDGLPALDIVFFALVAVFLVLRLRSALGKRTGNEKTPPSGWNRSAPSELDQDNVVDLASARKPAPEPVVEGPVGEGIAAIRSRDPSFSGQTFLSGARMAFDMIVGAFAMGDKTTLRPLLADEVYRPFAQAIEARDKAGEVLSTELVGIRKAEIIEARLDGTWALVTVRFVSEQVNVVKDTQGRILEGDPTRVIEITDDWTFRRDTSSQDPNWQLSATRSPDDRQD